MSTYRCTHSVTCAPRHAGWAARTATRTLSKTVSHGISAKFWKTTIRSMPGPTISRPSSTAPPALGRSRPAMMLSSVDLPHPEWPTMVRNSPWSSPKATSRNTQTSPRPSGAGKCLVT